MNAIVARLIGRRGSSEESGEPLRPLFNFNEVSSEHWMFDDVRVSVFTGKLGVHYHTNEDGFMVVLKAANELSIGDEVGRAEKGDVYGFNYLDWHGFVNGGKALVFHGAVPYEKTDGYTIEVCEYTPHPDGGMNKKIVWHLDEEPEEQIWDVFGPDVNMTLQACLRDVDEKARRLMGHDVNDTVTR